jgi:gamma-F420-2:alpha-L-glutamate ligase
MNKGLVLTKHTPALAYEHSRVVEECVKSNTPYELHYYEDLSVLLDGEQLTLYDQGIKVPVESFSWCFLRSANVGAGANYIELRDMIIHELKKNGSRVLNGDSYEKWPVLTKITQYYYLQEAGITFPLSQYGVGRGETDIRISWPLMAKTVNGSRGEGVFKVNNFEELQACTQKAHLSRFVLQHKLNAREDLRILVLGKKILGVMKRIAPEGSFLTNVSRGGSAEPYKLTPELTDLTQKIIQAFTIDFGGIDVMLEKGKPYVLEINRYPQYRGFERTMGINVAKEVVEYLVK